MISPEEFSKTLHQLGFDTAVGVPDSTFKGLISYFSSQDIFKHIIASSECEAMAIASGYYLGQKKPALVYMQNSGFCKTLNPFTSLLSDDVYGVPALMLVGWRGEPGKKDEPQHKMMGRIMIDLFKVMEIDHLVLDENKWQEQLQTARQYIQEKGLPFIIAIPKGVFDDYKIKSATSPYAMTREEVLEVVVANTTDNVSFVSTTGKTSRELFEIRARNNDDHGKDFYTVGSMGCASSIAFGVGLADSSRVLYILDGDGAALMQLGNMTTLGHYKNSRLKHILIDNGAHESTGGQPTVSQGVNFLEMGKACGYESVVQVDNREDLLVQLKNLEINDKLSLLVVKVKKGSRPDLGRPTTTPKENRDAFIRRFRG